MSVLATPVRPPRAEDPRPSPDELAKLVRTLQSSLYLRVEVGEGGLSLLSGVRDRIIGAVNLETGALTARLPSHLVDPLLAGHPELRPTEEGVGVRVTDSRTRRVAQVLIRWRIELERYAPQLHNASP